MGGFTLGAAMSQSQATQALSQNEIQFNPILNIFSDRAGISPTQKGGGTSLRDSGVSSTATATAKPSVGFGGGGESDRSGVVPSASMVSNRTPSFFQGGAINDPDTMANYSEILANGPPARSAGRSVSLNPVMIGAGALVAGFALWYFLK